MNEKMITDKYFNKVLEMVHSAADDAVLESSREEEDERRVPFFKETKDGDIDISVDGFASIVAEGRYRPATRLDQEELESYKITSIDGTVTVTSPLTGASVFFIIEDGRLLDGTP